MFRDGRIPVRFFIVCSFFAAFFFTQCVQFEDPFANTGLTVSYHANGGEGTVPQEHQGLQPKAVIYVQEPKNLKKAGWKFVAWTPDLDSPENYKVGDMLTIEDKNIILYARWERQDDPQKLIGRWKVTKKDNAGITGTTYFFVFNGFKYDDLSDGKNNPVIEYIADRGNINDKNGNVLLRYTTDRDTVNDRDLLFITKKEDGKEVIYRCERDPNFEYSFSPGKTESEGATILSYSGNKDIDLSIPGHILGLKTTAIGARAFFQTPLKTVVIPAGVTGIGDDAFAYCGLTAVTIPDTVTTIGARAFQANKLAVINLPSGLRDLVIYLDATEKTPPPGILGIPILPDGLTDPVPGVEYTRFYPAIGVSAFADSSPGTKTSAILNLGNPPGPFSIGESAFARTRLASSSTAPLNFPKGIKDFPVAQRDSHPGRVFPGIGANAFDAFKSGYDPLNFLESITFDPEITLETIGNGAFRNNEISALTFPASIKKIGMIDSSLSPAGAFEGNPIAGTLVIPGTVREIGPYAFADKNENPVIQDPMDRLTLEAGIEKIGEGAFYVRNKENNKLASSLSIPGSVTFIGRRAFMNNKLTGLDLTGVAELEIDEQAFAGNRIQLLTIPPGVIKLGKGAFRDCGIYLKTIDLSQAAGITKIAASVFAGSSALRKVIIPEGIVAIDQNAFYGCINLAEVDISSTVTAIEKGAFYNTKLTTIVIRRTLPFITFPNADTDKNMLFGKYDNMANDMTDPTEKTFLAKYLAHGSGTYTCTASTDSSWSWAHHPSLPIIP
ncbi:MAG: leucine-rich repeat protein [Treponema sp.]|jgi:hypothetical protein|nr:leucine-rich repeat protein [Treponema sp.]